MTSILPNGSGPLPDSLAAARLSLAGRIADEVRRELDAGEPVRALERIQELARHKVSGPSLRRSREMAEAWQSGLAEGRRGEFGLAREHLDRALRLAAGAGAMGVQQAIATAKSDLENRQKVAAPKVEALYVALSEGKWPQILSAAEAVLNSVPDHSVARQARTRAWQQIAAIGPATAAQWPQRGERTAQANTMVEEDTLRESADPEHAAGSEGILWLNTVTKRRAGSALAGRLGDPASAALVPRPTMARKQSRRRGRSHRLRRPAPTAVSSFGLTPWADILFASTIESSSAALAPTAGRISRLWVTWRGTT